ncbi:FTR1 family iron permease [Paenibacillus sp. YIM B09110]|uniref:FTR1 family iron permease n=1 Tax=Paenibacillus sp. YIM B09110 TaxID=3126102 RepID=UPI00301BF3E3
MFARNGSSMKRITIRFCLAAFLIVSIIQWSTVTVASAGSTTDTADLDRLLPLVGGALVEAGQGKWEEAKGHVVKAADGWVKLQPEKTKEAEAVDAALEAAITALTVGEQEQDAAEAKSSLSTLAKAINSYAKSVKGEPDSSGKLSGTEAALAIKPIVQQLLVAVQQSDWTKAGEAYKQMNGGWPQVESAVRKDNFKVYGLLETKMSMLRIAIQAEPPRDEQAKSEAEALIQLINQYAAGSIADDAGSSGTELSVAGAIALLDLALKESQAERYAEAAAQMELFIAQWPSVEGEVQLRSASVYTNVEVRMAEIAGYLLSNPPQGDKANKLIGELQEQLRPMTGDTRYTAWDAGMILLREGLEAILVLAALLAYLKRTGNGSKSKWIWSGVWTGLALSGVMAFVLTYAIAKLAAGSAREAIEGVAGLLSVVLMLTVGNWLHSKSNMKSWTQYIDNKMGSALAKGSLWSLFAVSALAIFREGAETTIFYIGMAPSIEPLQLALGFGVTFVLLIGLGFAIIRFSAKLPIKPFFLLASALIYYLVIRFLGESIHSLQVAGWLPSNTLSGFPTIGFLGAYPTWETTIVQSLVLIYIITKWLLSARKKSVASSGVLSES